MTSSISELSELLTRIDSNVPLTHTKHSSALYTLFHCFQQESLHVLSKEKIEHLYTLYSDVCQLFLPTNYRLIEAVQALQQQLPLFHGPIDHRKSQSEAIAWQRSERSERRTVYERIQTLLQEMQMLESEERDSTTLSLDLSNLNLTTLPSSLFTDPRFAAVDIEIRGNRFMVLPPSLTLGSLRNSKLYELFIKQVSQRKLLPSSSLETCQHIHCVMPEEVTQFIRALEESNHPWVSLTNFSCPVGLLRDEDLFLIASKCPNIKEMDLSNSHKITDVGLQHVALRLKSLQGLNLQRCFQVTDASLQHIALHLKHLNYLNLKKCIHISGNGLQQLTLCQHLRYLDLSSCHQITDAELLVIGTLYELSYLNLTDCKRITDAGLLHVSKLSHLQDLHLSQCDRITDAGLEYIGNRLIRLRRLWLNECYEVTDKGLEFLTKLTELYELQLNNCYKITDNGLLLITRFRKLHSLGLNDCHEITDRGVDLISRIRELQRLWLKHCPQISEAKLKMLKELPSIKLLASGD